MRQIVAKRARRAGAGTCLALVLALAAAPAWGKGEPSIKIGINRVVISGVEYAQQDTTTKVTDANADSYSGTDLFFEWVASDHYSLEVTSAVTPLRRSYQLPSATGALASNVNETAAYTLVGANLYFSRASARGMQYLLGVSTGTVVVAHTFEGGTMAPGSTLSTSNTLPISAVRFAIDWVTDLAGVRLQYQNFAGTSSNTTQLLATAAKQTVTFNGSSVGLGVYAFF